MHHITPFRDEKFINLLGRGTASPQTPPLAAYGSSILASSALDLQPPQCSSGVDAHGTEEREREREIVMGSYCTLVWRKLLSLRLLG